MFSIPMFKKHLKPLLIGKSLCDRVLKKWGHSSLDTILVMVVNQSCMKHILAVLVKYIPVLSPKISRDYAEVRCREDIGP